MERSPLPLSRQALPPPPDAGQPLEGLDESTWVDVIQKMDEVYARLIEDEVALERQNAELEASQRFIVSVLSAMSDVLVVCDPSGRIERANAALCELVGVPEAQLLGTPLWDRLADEASVAAARAAMAGPLSGRRAEATALNLRDGQGRAVPVDAHCTPRLDARGQRLGSVWVGRPMAELRRAYTELKAAHDALKRTQQQLLHAEKMASLGQLVAGVAHELNNPISFVLGNVHALRRYCERLRGYMEALEAPDADPQALQTLRQRLRIGHLLADLPSLLDGTLEGAQRTADIVHGLKRFSAMDREERAPLDLNPVITRALHWVQKGQPGPMAVDWTPGPPLWVLGNDGQLQQVLMNLLQNAFDAMASQDPATRRVALHAEREGTRVRVRVRDHGPGIAPEHLSRVFDPFFTTKPVGKGTGLGLSISYGIAEQHGGHLEVAPAEGGGAVFTLTLPSAAPPGA